MGNTDPEVPPTRMIRPFPVFFWIDSTRFSENTFGFYLLPTVINIVQAISKGSLPAYSYQEDFSTARLGKLWSIIWEASLGTFAAALTVTAWLFTVVVVVKSPVKTVNINCHRLWNVGVSVYCCMMAQELSQKLSSWDVLGRRDAMAGKLSFKLRSGKLSSWFAEECNRLWAGDIAVWMMRWDEWF